MRILVINGPNLNMLGIREPEHYGKETYADLEEKISTYCQSRNIAVTLYQSNYEGALVDEIQKAYGEADGIVINPGAYTHTSIAILDALTAVGIPAVEVHISKLEEREDFRQVSYIRRACTATITGRGTDGYLEAIDFLLRFLKGEHTQGHGENVAACDDARDGNDDGDDNRVSVCGENVSETCGENVGEICGEDNAYSEACENIVARNCEELQ